ncbi:hypothetical protein [Halobellus rubicundus]|uniref:SWIM-type domain-containing protein n=1 Tax=Halobellus rubicundus TaxID=2996466 RepID=A0ABD5M8C0_9EURY
MSSTHSGANKPHDDRSIDDLDKRDVRALTEAMSVLPDYGRARGADGLFVVIGENSNDPYLVDVVGKACECPDAEYRDPDGGCKHIKRIEYATGRTAIPQWVDRDVVDDNLGCAVDAEPRYAVADGGIIEADDDGEIIDDDTNGRPEDCDCGPWNADAGLPCWPCYRDGFRMPVGEIDG